MHWQPLYTHGTASIWKRPWWLCVSLTDVGGRSCRFQKTLGPCPRTPSHPKTPNGKLKTSLLTGPIVGTTPLGLPGAEAHPLFSLWVTGRRGGRSAAVKHSSPARLTQCQAGAQTSAHIINESIICHTGARPAGAPWRWGGSWERVWYMQTAVGSPQGLWHAATAVALSLMTDMQSVSAAGQWVHKYN